jgi:hypothetical protein
MTKVIASRVGWWNRAESETGTPKRHEGRHKEHSHSFGALKAPNARAASMTSALPGPYQARNTHFKYRRPGQILYRVADKTFRLGYVLESNWDLKRTPALDTER